MSYYIVQNDETKGPLTIGQLRSMWNAGTVNSDTLYCEEGFDTWLHLRVLAEQLESPSVEKFSGFSPQARFKKGITAHKIKKVEFAGGGAAVQLVGLLLCLTLVGAIFGIPLIIIGRSMSTKFLCSNCANKLSDKAVTICPVCHASLS
jgi:hypothetical protein